MSDDWIRDPLQDRHVHLHEAEGLRHRDVAHPEEDQGGPGVVSAEDPLPARLPGAHRCRRLREEEEGQHPGLPPDDQDHQRPVAHRRRPGPHPHKARNEAPVQCHHAQGAPGQRTSQSESQPEECPCRAQEGQERRHHVPHDAALPSGVIMPPQVTW